MSSICACVCYIMEYMDVYSCIVCIGEKLTTKKLPDDDSGTESDDSHTISSGN